MLVSYSSSSGAITSGTRTFTVANATGGGADLTVAAPLVNGNGVTASLAKAGLGTMVLTANNTYTGGTAISAAALQIGNGGSGASIGSTSNVLDNGGLVFNHSDNVTFSPIISGGGSLTQTGSGALTLTGSNTYSGGTTVNGGMLSGGL